MYPPPPNTEVRLKESNLSDRKSWQIRPHLSAFILAIVPALAVAFSASAEPTDPVHIGDNALRHCVESALGVDAGATITEADMATIGSLGCAFYQRRNAYGYWAPDPDRSPYGAVYDLSGLQFAVNLSFLLLHNNKVSDLSPLAGLPLTELRLHGNGLSDLSPLAGITSLTDLGLSSNEISDLSPLAGLASLTSLIIGVNPISDISPLARLTSLEALQLYSTPVSDISALAGLTALTDLRLPDNAISDIAALASNVGLDGGGNFGLGDSVDLSRNPLNEEAHTTHIPALQSRGAWVHFDPYDPSVGDPPNDDPNPDDPTPDDPPEGEDQVPLAAIPDAALRLCVERALDKEPGATISEAEMAGLDELYCAARIIGHDVLTSEPIYDPERSPHGPVANLAGLELAVTLIELRVPGNFVTDLSPLAGLPLATLQATDGHISDLSPLASVPTLTSLSVGLNAVTDLSPLAGLTSLTELSLGGNAISDVSALAGLESLTFLSLSSNAIADVSPLSGLTALTYLSLDNNSIADISPLATLTALTELYLQNNRISDIAALAANAGLGAGDHIGLSANPLDSAARIKHIPALQGLGANVYYDPVIAAIPDAALLHCLERTLDKEAGAPITEAEMASIGQFHCNARFETGLLGEREYDPERSPHGAVGSLAGLELAVNLSDVSLRHNAVSDLSPLAGLPLVQLSLRHNAVSDLSPVAGMASLKGLYLSGNPLTDLSAVAGMTSLTSLVAVGNGIADLSPLAGLASLNRLALGANAIADVTPLAGLRSLTSLGLGDNAISNIAPLGKLTALQYLGIYSNSIVDISALKDLTSLGELYLANNAVSDLAPLAANTGLGAGDYVEAHGNPVACGSQAEPVRALRARGVWVSVDDVVLPAPRQLEATPGDGSVALRWRPPTECAVDAYEFRVGSGDSPTFGDWRSMDNGGETVHTVDGLANGLVHVFEVRAVGDGGGRASQVKVALAATPSAPVAIVDAKLSAGIARALAAMAQRNSPPSASDAQQASQAVVTQGQMAMLTDLDLRRSGIADLRGIDHAVNLRTLLLGGNEVAGLSPLANLRFLSTLDLARNNIADVSALAGLDGLQSLWLGANQLTDVAALGELAGLTVLALDDNEIADVSPFAHLHGLERLWLNDNAIVDISPLAANTGLGEGELRPDGSSDYVDLRGNPLDDDATHIHAQTLRQRGAAVLVDDAAHRIPAFATAGNPMRKSLLRVVNPTKAAGEATISAIDAAGGRFGPVTLSLGAGKAVNLTAHDLEAGNAAKGLASGFGPGDGDLRLALRSTLPLGVSAYMGGRGALTTSMKAVVPERYAKHRLGVFFGSGAKQTSLLRLINPGAKAARAVIEGMDDSGASGEVAVIVPAGGTRDFTAAALEAGAGPGVLSGGLGRGAGMWRLTATSYDGVQVVNLLEDAAGQWANLSAPSADAGQLLLFPAMSAAGRPTGLARLINHSSRRGTVQVTAVDGAGRSRAAGALVLEPGQSRQFTSADLEQGNSNLGLRGVGGSGGDWRLRLDADVGIGVYGFLQGPSGLLSSLQERVPLWQVSLVEETPPPAPTAEPRSSDASGRLDHRLMFFKPWRNGGDASRLRLVNVSSAVADVRVSAIDDDGKPAGSVRLSLAAGASRELTAQDLETGQATGVVGRLRVGNGMWRLVVEADAKLEVMNLLDGPGGRLTNLSAGG